MVDPRTPRHSRSPGQFTERVDDPGYRGMSSVELATEAVRAALADTGTEVAAVAAAIELFAGLRQFEICSPFTKPAFGCSDNYMRSVARRVGADPARAVLESIGGNGPQKLVTEFAGSIAAGDIEVALVLGSEPGSTEKYYAGRDDKPDFSETVGGQLEDRGYGYEQYMSEYTAKHGLTGAPVQYGLLDNARRARLGRSVADYRRDMAELFALLSKVAAKNPFSFSPVERSVTELITVTDQNRMICDPYPRLMVARDQVNQARPRCSCRWPPRDGSGCPKRSGCICTAMPARPSRTCSTGPISASASQRNSRWRKHFGSPASPSTRSVPSTSTAASPSRSSRCAMRAASHPTTRQFTRPADCRTSADPATATPCMRSPRSSPKCGTPGHSAWWEPMAV